MKNQQDNILVSVIVPVYNTELYLEECIESILRQTRKVYEIILVDDDSNDSSSKICDSYAQQYNNVKVIHKRENVGISGARNEGMKIATGEYLLFCDSDDKLKEDMIEYFCQVITDNEALDIVMCGYQTFPNGRVVLPQFPYDCVLKGKDLIKYNRRIHSDNEFCFSWRFLFRRRYLIEKDIWFDEKIKIGEDILFNTKAIMETEKLWVLDKTLYMYRINNENSIMRTRYKPNLPEDLMKQYREKIKISDTYGLMNDEGWKFDLAFYYVTGFRDMLFRNVMNGPEENKKKKLQKILKLELLTENYKRLGNRIYKGSKRAAIFHFFCKHRFVNCVYNVLKATDV